MELKYPFAIIIIIITTICYFRLSKKKPNTYKKGTKIANTKYVKESEYYKKKIKEYNIIKYLILSLFSIGAICSTILITRLIKVETVNLNEYNRDIFLCMDVSRSVFELNLELVDNLKETVNKLHGERFGILIFNTTSIVVSPLTDDYDYVINILDMIKKSIESNNSTNYDSYLDDDYFYVKDYIFSGTLEGNETRGSSLIGDGLASCVYSFSNYDADRTRIIIFTTDNDLMGTPIVTLETAAKISKSKDVKVFGIGTKTMMDKQEREEFKNAVEYTGGKYYEHSNSTVQSIVKDIESTSKSLLDNKFETKKTDIPEVPFIILILSILGIIIVSKKVVK